MYYFAILLAILSSTTYHLSTKYAPQAVNPFFILFFVYLIGMLLSVVGIATAKTPVNFSASFKQLTPAVLLMGFAIMGIETGFLLAYRSGWNISLAALITNVIVAMALVPVGLTIFQEKLSTLNLLGILVCVMGLVMLSWGR
jgi:multidrug transporter EmrE-like cation transporter